MRVKPVDPDALDAEGAQLYRTIAGPRGGVADGPFRAWLRSNPELAARMHAVGGALRGSGNLDLRLAEIAILAAARFWDARYQWTAHVPIALECGIAQQTIDEIGRGVRPASAPDDQRAVFDLATGLLAQHRIPDDLYRQLIDQIGFDGMVELVTMVGQYSMAAIVINGFEIELSADGPQLPDRA